MAGEHKVTLAIYSGRPDPVWTIHPRHESSKDVKKHLDHAKANGNTHRHEHMPSNLGYKGFLVHQPDDEQAHLIVGEKTKALQKVLLDSMPEGSLSDALRQKVLEAIDSGAVTANVPDGSQARKRDKDYALHYAPELNLARWNNDYLIRANNNCYNYCNDKITNSFAQPGRHPIPGPSTTAKEVLRRAESDGLKKVVVEEGDPCPKAPPQPNCLVALVVAEGEDYHWYRLDNNQRWSHKPGPTEATNFDGKGKLISDPRKAANNPHGPDYKFVSFMKIFTNIIDGPLGPH